MHVESLNTISIELFHCFSRQYDNMYIVYELWYGVHFPTYLEVGESQAGKKFSMNYKSVKTGLDLQLL